MLTQIASLLSEAGIAGRADVADVTPLRGGAIASVWMVRLANGTSVVVKTADDPPDGMFAAEIAGLDALSGPLRTPAVIDAGARWLVLEALDPCPEGPAAEFWAAAGREIARLHGVAGARFGWHSDGWLGRLPQRNAWSEDGHEFFATQRVLRYLDEPKVGAALGPAGRSALERLCDRLPELIPASPPVLTHGDLWRGNTLSADGDPVFIDPAVCWMWAETDISMMYCTARFAAPDAFFAAYDEVRPLAAGWRDRMPILHLCEQLSLVAHFGAQPETMAAMQATIKPFGTR
jgi:fructosamine-3-kinase